MAHSARIQRAIDEMREAEMRFEGKKLEYFMALAAETPSNVERLDYRSQADACRRTMERLIGERRPEVSQQLEVSRGLVRG